MGKIISLPKAKTQRALAIHKFESKRFFYSLSVFSIITMAIFITEKLNRQNLPQYIFAVNFDGKSKLNRAIASEEKMEFVETIRWGQELVDKINENDRLPAALGRVPDQHDIFRYGELAGNYRILTSTDGHQPQMEIEYVESARQDERPIRLKSTEQFLKENKSLLSIAFDKIHFESRTSQQEVFQLLGAEGKIVGKAKFGFDDTGRFLSLKVENQ